jgi:hypothetical protein
MITRQECATNETECLHAARYSGGGTKRRHILFAMARTWATLGKHAGQFENLP